MFQCWERQRLTGIGDLGDLVALEAVPTLVTPRIHELNCGQTSAWRRKQDQTVTYVDDVQRLGNSQ